MQKTEKAKILILMLSLALIGFAGCSMDNKDQEALADGFEVNLDEDAIEQEKSLVKYEGKDGQDDSMKQNFEELPVETNTEQARETKAEHPIETNTEQTNEITENQLEKGNGWSFQTMRGIVASPILVDDVIFFGSKDATFYAVDINTQKAVWSYETGNSIHCQAAVLDKTIFFSCADVFYALDIDTGKEVWTFDLEVDTTHSRRKDEWDYHDPTPIIDQGVVYFGCSSGGIRGFDAVTGQIVWEFDVNTMVTVRSTPLIYEGVIYYGDWKGNIQAVDIETKQLLWKNEYSGAFQSSVAVKDNILIIAGRDTRIHALDIRTGNQLWEYKDPNGSWITGDPTIEGGIVYIPTSDARLVYALNLYDGSVVRTYPNYKNAFTKALIVDGLIYITSGDAYAYPGTGKIEIYNIEQPDAIIWEVDVPTGGVFTTPILADGMIYYGCQDGYLYARTIK